MSNKKQTAVEFLYGEMASILNYEVDPVTALKIFDIYKQAKEMEKRQIMDARQDGHDSTSGCDSCGYKNSLDGSNESFYKETYGE